MTTITIKHDKKEKIHKLGNIYEINGRYYILGSSTARYWVLVSIQNGNRLCDSQFVRYNETSEGEYYISEEEFRSICCSYEYSHIETVEIRIGGEQNV